MTGCTWHRYQLEVQASWKIFGNLIYWQLSTARDKDHQDYCKRCPTIGVKRPVRERWSVTNGILSMSTSLDHLVSWSLCCNPWMAIAFTGNCADEEKKLSLEQKFLAADLFACLSPEKHQGWWYSQATLYPAQLWAINKRFRGVQERKRAQRPHSLPTSKDSNWLAPDWSEFPPIDLEPGIGASLGPSHY